MSLSDPTAKDYLRLLWFLGTAGICAYLGILMLWLAGWVLYAYVRIAFWAIRVDRLERDAIAEADEIAALRKFHETIDGTLDKILRRGQ